MDIVGDLRAPGRDAGAHLRAYGRVLSHAPHRLAPLVPTPASSPIETLRHRYRRDGYVWVKGLLDRQQVLDFRGRAFTDLAGLTRHGTPPGLGLANTAFLPRGRIDRDLVAFVRSAAFEGFCLQPGLVALMDELLGGLSRLHKRDLQHSLPRTAAATPAHRDLSDPRGETERIITAWIPIGDTPIVMGGPCFLEGSHHHGAGFAADLATRADSATPGWRTHFDRQDGSGENGFVSRNLPELAERFDTRWLIADYEAGDVVIHSSSIIHASTANDDPEGRIRLSAETRFRSVHDKADG